MTKNLGSAHFDRASHFPWPPVLFFGALFAGWAAQRFWPLSWPGLDDTPARVVGIALGLGGLALAGWGIATLKRHNTTVMPHGRVSELVTRGPFGYLRNPIYVGDVMILLGAAELSKNIWITIFAIVFVILVTWLAIFPEERHLEARFGQDYLDYKSRTRRWI